jgi:hypothetical protein
VKTSISALDVHQTSVSVAVLDREGKLTMECVLETKASTIENGLLPRKPL